MKRLSLFCLVALILGLVTRIPFFLANDFALNDGALFVQMSRAILENGYRLPSEVSYNNASIPFAYPPIAFYLVAGASDLLGMDAIHLVRILPLLFNLACTVLFVIFIARFIKHPRVVFLASVLFPLLPKSYEWLIMGGGITRSVGFFFTLVFLVHVARWIRSFDLKGFIIAAALLSCTWASHLEWGLTASVAVSLFALTRVREVPLARIVGSVAALGVMACLLTAPWWMSVIARHGFDPFLAASGTAGWERVPFAGFFLPPEKLLEPLRLLWSVAIVSGTILAVRKGGWAFAVWLPLVFLTTPRHGPSAATMPLAVVIAYALDFGLLRPFERGLRNTGTFSRTLGLERATSLLAFALALNFALSGARGGPPGSSPLVSLTKDERDAMDWVRAYTPPDAHFALVSESQSWEDDRIAEWFPLLTERQSVTTVQGLEWVNGRVFHHRIERIRTMKAALGQPIERQVALLERNFKCFDHVAVFKSDLFHREPRQSFFHRYQVVHVDPAVVVLKRRSQPACF